MKTKSCFSVNMDPYRAGIEIAKQLASINPEVIFIFPTIHYQGSPELTEAIYDELGSEDVVLIGNTGDGFLERGKVAGVGVSALAINSDKSVKWHLACEPGVKDDPAGAVERCLGNLNKNCSSDPALYFIASDFRTNATIITQTLNKNTSAPVIGGFAADDFKKRQCFLYANREVINDHIVMLAAEGPLAFDIRIAHDYNVIGELGVITECEGNLIKTINNIPAIDFIEGQTGKPFTDVDKGIFTFTITDETGKKKTLCIHSPKRGDKGSAELYGSVTKNHSVQVCLTPPERMVSDVRNISGNLSELPFEPIAALVVSCAGRKSMLKDGLKLETEEILKSCPSVKSLAGFPSFGEIGPLKTADGYSESIFHNMTLLLLTIGNNADDR